MTTHVKTPEDRAQERAEQNARWDAEVRPALERIADAIAPLVPAYMDAWSRLGRTEKTGAEELDDLVAMQRQLNSAIEPHVDDIARLTGNPASTIRQAYQPKDVYDVWFVQSNGDPAEFIRNVARFRSFNVDFWTNQGWMGYGKGIDLPPPQRLARERAEAEALGIDFTKGLASQAGPARSALQSLARERGYGPDDMSGTAVGRYFNKLTDAAPEHDPSEDQPLREVAR